MPSGVVFSMIRSRVRRFGQAHFCRSAFNVDPIITSTDDPGVGLIRSGVLALASSIGWVESSGRVMVRVVIRFCGHPADRSSPVRLQVPWHVLLAHIDWLLSVVLRGRRLDRIGSPSLGDFRRRMNGKPGFLSMVSRLQVGRSPGSDTGDQKHLIGPVLQKTHPAMTSSRGVLASEPVVRVRERGSRIQADS